ncbi:25S rRNA (cytosine-C(5))-methyltransferase NSUN5-like [Hevea brasiliensis]|uniref:25S rRNA (cytosine-C(5))-methyltransferase NSUN5-like n=1 Tax=Hevea brasiliensis TaxID=3981 RepID=UPI0025F57435|nr:25S rRNA (cytosine-C(5))-methyltransferase NSUN5-like [Hevea brasiliensis]
MSKHGSNVQRRLRETASNKSAYELNKDRIKYIEHLARLSDATNIKVLYGDFLNLNPKDPSFSKIRAILLDPSCSGSGTTAQRLDHLLPSHATDVTDAERPSKLSAFQRKALAHALSFPAVERVVDSTCSVNQIENEDVIMSVLPLATSHGFQLVTPFPGWHRCGLPVFSGSEHLLRTDPIEDQEGFFIALFVKKSNINDSEEQNGIRNTPRTISTQKRHFKRYSNVNRKSFLMPAVYSGALKILYSRLILQRRTRRTKLVQ